PFLWIDVPPSGEPALDQLATRMQPYQATRRSDLPPFQGGAAGVLGYELARSLEQIPAAAQDEFKFPALAAGLYDVVVAFDLHQEQGWVISQGWPVLDPQARRERAEARMSELLQRIACGPDQRRSDPDDLLGEE